MDKNSSSTVLLVFALCLLGGGTLAGQSDPQLLSFGEQLVGQQKTAMLSLGGWALVNIGAGLALRGGTEGSTRHFHEMNALWNTVNLAIAGFGYYSALRSDPAGWDLATAMTEQQSFQKILLFNAGLDIGYIMGGLYLTERARRPGENEDRLRGFGNSVMLQGGFLFIFDLVNYFIARKPDAVQWLSLRASADQIGVLLTF